MAVNRQDSVVIGIFIVVALLFAFVVERAKWSECRRYHPAWYCALGGGR
jgi:hypothetical protein